MLDLAVRHTKQLSASTLSYSPTDSVREQSKSIVSTPVQSKSTLQSLIQELSFWDAASSFSLPDSQQRQQPTYASETTKQRRAPSSSTHYKRGRSLPLQNTALHSSLRSESGAIHASSTRIKSEPNMNYFPGYKRRQQKPSESSSSSSSSSQKKNRMSPKPVWKSAVDPATGRTYYYDIISRKTQWDKPEEMRISEKRKKSEKLKRDIKFFREMEENLKASLHRGELIPGINRANMTRSGPPQDPSPPTLKAENRREHRVRTFSGMEDVNIMAALRDNSMKDLTQQPQNVHRANAIKQTLNAAKTTHIAAKTNKTSKGKPPLPSQGQQQQQKIVSALNNMELSPDEGECKTSMTSRFTSDGSLSLTGEQFADDGNESVVSSPRTSPPKPLSPPSHVRRNTGGTIYVKNTMSNPDINATIKCVCGVYRAHMLQAAQRNVNQSPVSTMTHSLDLEIFKEVPAIRQHGSRYQRHIPREDNVIPTLADIMAFYQEFYKRSQMEHDTIIMSLIYVERLLKETNGLLAPVPGNWRSVLFSCMVLASKVWDDLSMWNIDFSNVSASSTKGLLASFTLRRINQLELALLKSLNFDVRVSASEYAKYYFLIRSMSLKSGLVFENDIKPLGKKEAEKLETRTSQYQDSKIKNHSRRAISLDDYSFLEQVQPCVGDSVMNRSVSKDKVCLEELISMKG